MNGAPPQAPAVLMVGGDVLALPLMGGVLLPSPDLLLPLSVDGQGHASLAWESWPLAAGSVVYAQARLLEPDLGAVASASNALMLTTQ